MNTDDELRDQMITEAYPLVAIEARRCTSLPPGINVDDLESLGGEVLIEAYANYDPASGKQWLGYAKLWLRNKFRSFLQKARMKAKKMATLEIETDEGDFRPRPDVRVSDPGELVSAREAIAPRRQSARSTAGSLPSPVDVANKVTRLREAMFAAIKESDIEQVMQTVVANAKKGDTRSTRLLLDLLAPSRSGVTVQQQAIVIQNGDLS